MNPSPSDVLIVGGGPAGATAATFLARNGWTVDVLEARPDDRLRPSSRAILTPRAVYDLEQVGVDVASLPSAHRVDFVRLAYAADPDNATTIPWPRGGLGTGSRRGTTNAGLALVVDRAELDRHVLALAIDAGATVRRGCAATGPIVERGFVRGAVAHGDRRHLARYIVVADGADSRFGRELGTFRRKSWPWGLGIRARYRVSPTAEDDAIEFIIGLRDRNGSPIAGHAWMFHCGDGTAVVGAIIMSTSPTFRVLNPARLLNTVVGDNADRWMIEREPLGAPTGARIPLGTSVGPLAGPTFVVVGDAGGTANPLTGAGIEYAIETAGFAATVIDRALETESSTALQTYPEMVDQRFENYFKFGRLTNRILSSPSIGPRVAQYTARRRWAAETVLRIGANQLRRRPPGLAELIVDSGQLVDLITPSA